MINRRISNRSVNPPDQARLMFDRYINGNSCEFCPRKRCTNPTTYVRHLVSFHKFSWTLSHDDFAQGEVSILNHDDAFHTKVCCRYCSQPKKNPEQMLCHLLGTTHNAALVWTFDFSYSTSKVDDVTYPATISKADETTPDTTTPVIWTEIDCSNSTAIRKLMYSDNDSVIFSYVDKKSETNCAYLCRDVPEDFICELMDDDSSKGKTIAEIKKVVNCEYLSVFPSTPEEFLALEIPPVEVESGPDFIDTVEKPFKDQKVDELQLPDISHLTIKKVSELEDFDAVFDKAKEAVGEVRK